MADEKVLTIKVSNAGPGYQDKIISFTDHHSNIPAELQANEHNPTPALRNCKMIGMDVLTGLKYDSSENKWTGGEIYDTGSRKSYSASVELADDGTLSAGDFPSSACSL